MNFKLLHIYGCLKYSWGWGTEKAGLLSVFVRTLFLNYQILFDSYLIILHLCSVLQIMFRVIGEVEKHEESKIPIILRPWERLIGPTITH